MKNKIIGIIICTLLISTATIPVTGHVIKNKISISLFGNEFVYVDDDADSSWYNETHVKTIQEGINNVSTGGTVFVYNGTYYENPVISKSLDLIGESKENTIVNSSHILSNVIMINTNWVNVSKFTIENCFGIEEAGIKVGADHCQIKEMIFRDNIPYGLSLNPSDYTTISDSTFSNNRIGIYMKFSDHNTISGNIASGNGQYGIACAYSNHNDILNNKASSNGVMGISTNKCSYFTIFNNTVASNDQKGIYTLDSNNMNAFENDIYDNNDYGIECVNSNNNIIYHNDFSNNGQNAKDNIYNPN